MAKSSKTYLGVLRGTVPSAGRLEDVARVVGCSVNALSMYERGERALSDETVRKYARALKTPESRVRQLHVQEGIRFHERRAELLRESLKAGKPLGKGAVAVG